MKKNVIKSLVGFATFAAMAIFFFACSKDDSEPTPVEDTSSDIFWLYSRIGSYPDQSDLIAEVTRENIENPNYTFTLLGNGAEVQEKITYGQAVKNGYYYCVSKDQRFGKYRVKDGQLVAVLEVPYANLYNNFSYAWKDDNTLVIFGPDGTNTKLVYSEINTNTLAMTNGELAIPAMPDGFDRIRAQEAVYRDGKIFLGYQYWNSTAYNVQPGLKVLLLNASTYAIEKTITDSRSDNFGDSNGGLFQSSVIKDKNNDIYVAVTTGYKSGNTYSSILRIKSGETEFDTSYEVNRSETEASAGLWDLGNGKAIFRIRNASYMQTYNVMELATGSITKLDIPETASGSDANVAVDQESGKVYILATPDTKVNNNVRIYSIESGALSNGMIIPPGYTNLLRLDYIGKSE